MNDKTDQLLTAKPVPVMQQFQGRDGMWHNFIDERHFQNTVEDGSWPIRNLYTQETIDNLLTQLAEAQDALQATQRELQSCKDGRAISVDDFIVTFRCEDKGIVGKTNAKIHSVSQHDDGVIEVMIDHWPYSVEIANR